MIRRTKRVLSAVVLVSAGLHFKERRFFEYVAEYIKTINALAPKFRDPYRLADTLITMQSAKVPKDAYFATRDILRRGMKERPNDYRLWITAGHGKASHLGIGQPVAASGGMLLNVENLRQHDG